MAVDLGDLVESLQREVNPPGTNFFPNASDDDWLGHLRDAFWEARLHGLLTGYTEDEGEVTPISGDTDLSRDLQQLIVLYAGFRITLTQFQNINSGFRAKAGPVEFEQNKSAQTLKGVLDAIKARISLVLDNLSEYGGAHTAVLDAVIERTYSQSVRETWWVR
jgi:hypothetical protein